MTFKKIQPSQHLQNIMERLFGSSTGTTFVNGGMVYAEIKTKWPLLWDSMSNAYFGYNF